MKREINLTFHHLKFKIEEILIQLAHLHFANAFLWEHLKTEDLKELLKAKIFIGEHGNREVTSYLDHSGWRLINFVEGYAKMIQSNFTDTCDTLFKINAHFIKTKAINNAYELLMNYFESIDDSVKSKKIRDTFHKEDWFKILYLLRNNAAHIDNFGKLIDWQKYPKEKTVSWGNITINENDMGHMIKYDDLEILKLLNHIANFLYENKAILEQ